MAVKSTKKPASGFDNWKGYVNWSPTVADKALVVEYMAVGSWDASAVIQQLCESGYTVSHSWDDKSGCIRVSVTGKTPPCPNVGYTLSVRASSVERGLGIVGFYCFVLCQSGDWLIDKAGEEVW
jgi:hypothetical protein